MKRTLKLWTLTLLGLLFAQNSIASHVLGGDIKYIYLSPTKYKVVYKLYRECSGVPLDLKQVRFGVSSADGNVDATVTVNRTSIKDISLVCKKDTLPCDPINTTTNSGTEEHVFESLVDFTQSPYNSIKSSSCKVLFYFSVCCRTGAVTTMSPGNFYLDAMVDLCAVKNIGNTSPVFRTLPLRNLCCSTPFSYNNGGLELAEGDSLSFELSAPLKGLNDPETYTGSFTPSIPMTPYCPPNPGVVNCQALPNAKPPRGFYFDKETGDVVFTPTKCDEAGVLLFKINEWRKDSVGVWQIIGYVKRESTWIVQQCTDNNPPYFTGNNKYSVCEGNKLCFTIGTKDVAFLPKQTTFDTVQLTWDSGIAKATFRIIDPTAREKEAEFCWQTSAGDARASAFRFTAIANDNFCGAVGQASKTYIISVKPKSADNLVYKKLFKGGVEIFANPLNGSSGTSNTYKNIIRDSSNSGAPLYNSYNKQRDTFVFTKPGKYILEHEINNPPYNCPTFYYDTITVTADDLTGIINYRKIDLNVYPNPSNGQISFNSSSLDVREAFIKVYAVDGKFVAEKQLQAGCTDLSSLAKGIYTIAVKVEGYNVYRQLIIE
jgi:hypothetical protein